MKDHECVQFLQWALPQLQMRWPGFRKVRRQVGRRIDCRLQELGLADVGVYREYLQAHRNEWAQLDALCRIPISRFYRDRRVFDLLRQDVLPRLAVAAMERGNDTLRGWSAGCASGEEVYTLNIIWQLAVQPMLPRLSFDLVATDAAEHMIQRARRGGYPPSSLKDFPAEWLVEAFDRAGDDGAPVSRGRGYFDWP